MTPRLLTALLLCHLLHAPARGSVQVETGYSPDDKGFRIDRIAPPSRNDAASTAEFILVDGRRDGNGGDLAVLHNGRVPFENDVPSENFFLAGTGGRIAVDLGRPVSVKAIRTYSWHRGARGPQVYQVFAARGDEAGFRKEPKQGTDPAGCGWKPLARVDTRAKGTGGQHAASITGAGGAALGEIRHLLFEIQATEISNSQTNTFFSEIDVVDANGPALEATSGKITRTYQAPDGKHTYVVDSTVAPDLAGWAEKELMPEVYQWYPKIVALLPSEGFKAHRSVVLEFRDDMGGTPAYAAGNKVSMSAPWFRSQLKGEARGSVIHELTHVVQNYGWARRKNPQPAPTPGWVTEGIPDYVRWFLYEPQSKGAEITRGNFAGARYDGSYRISANFLHWVIETHDHDFLRHLNTAAREGRYSDAIWKERTGRTAAELGAEWKAANAKRLGL